MHSTPIESDFYIKVSNMDRKSPRDTRNDNENVRNFLLQKSNKFIFKKQKNFSILCDINIDIIIFRREEILPNVWKSTNLSKEVLVRYSKFREEENIKKLMIHEEYLQRKWMRKKKKWMRRKKWKSSSIKLVEGKNIAELTTREI